jgi:hypothetical protein
MIMAYDNVKSVISVYDVQTKTFQEFMKAELKNVFDEFFKICPEIKTVVWEQYTPYFNDGEPCEFRVGEIRFRTDNEEDDNEYDTMPTAFAGKPWSYERSPDSAMALAYNEAIKNPRYDFITSAINEFETVLRSIPDTIYLSSFEDHVKVVVTREGFEVSEYEHD